MAPEGTVYTHLELFFEAFEWNSDFGEDDASGARLKEELSNDHSILALVTIEGQEGRIDPNGTIAHWVDVKEITEDGVRVYNPFTNRFEDYDWEDFRRAWAETPGNNSTYLFVTGEQPQE